MKAKLIMSGLAALSVMTGTSSAYAQDAARDAIAERLAPVGQLCLQSQDCGTAAATASSSGVDAIDGAGVYNSICMACHETGAAGAPIRGDEAAWAERKEQGFATLLEHSINGIGAMPAKGGNPNLSDEEMEAVTAYLLEPVMDVPALGGGDEAASENVATVEEGATTSDNVAGEEVAVANAETDDDSSALDGAALYTSAGCTVCHTNGIAGAPTLGDSAAWAARLEKGPDELYANAINGLGVMPAKGGRPNLSDEEVMAIVDYMIAEVE